MCCNLGRLVRLHCSSFNFAKRWLSGRSSVGLCLAVSVVLHLPVTILQTGWTPVIPASGSTTVTITQGGVAELDFLNHMGNCTCGNWNMVTLFSQAPTGYIDTYTCGIVNPTAQALRKGRTYWFRYRYNCNPPNVCTPTYTMSEDRNGTVTTIIAGNFFNVFVTPNQQDCGNHSITVTPTCGTSVCPPCTIFFRVEGCDTCVESLSSMIYCDSITAKPVIEFCLRNLGTGPSPVQYFGVMLPPGVLFTDTTPIFTCRPDHSNLFQSGVRYANF